MKFKDGIDISIPFRTNPSATSAWYVGPITIEPVKGDGFIGSIEEGGSVNFRNITLNPHGNGTHTECVGHISPECQSINQHLTQWMFDAILITIDPSLKDGDRVIEKKQIVQALGENIPEALVLRTTPNSSGKLNHNYSNTNPAYLDWEAAAWMAKVGIKHLLLDLPSVDREVDEGELRAHRAFWNYPEAPRMDATITELIFVPDNVLDGEYTLNLQVAPIENDAAPSRPVLYPR
jgi:arylformamidase